MKNAIAESKFKKTINKLSNLIKGNTVGILENMMLTIIFSMGIIMILLGLGLTKEKAPISVESASSVESLTQDINDQFTVGSSDPIQTIATFIDEVQKKKVDTIDESVVIFDSGNLQDADVDEAEEAGSMISEIGSEFKKAAVHAVAHGILYGGVALITGGASYAIVNDYHTIVYNSIMGLLGRN